jgi:hypothetical protein
MYNMAVIRKIKGRGNILAGNQGRLPGGGNNELIE